MSRLITSATNFAGMVLKDTVREGDICVDATAGNGNDTLLLARLVGETGLVHAFDVQAEAIANTRDRLIESGFESRAVLHLAGHERMPDILPEEACGRIRALTFNLGFLPHSDERVVTGAETTLSALDASLELLAPDGVITIVGYTGHPGGAEEVEAVHAWCENLDVSRRRALRYETVNKKGAAIRLYIVQSLERYEDSNDG